MRKSMASLVTTALAAALLAIAASLVGAGPARAGELAGQLVAASGLVEIRPLGEAAWRPAALRAVVHPGDMVRTGPGAAAAVALVQGVVRLDENTVLILPPPRPVPAAAAPPTALRILLYKGRALFQMLRDRLEGGFEVITPSVIVGVKGTTFGVQQLALVGVVVFAGSVEVGLTGRPGDPRLTVGANQVTTVGPDGRLTPARPYVPGAPGAPWTDGPTTAQDPPLPAAPPEAEAPAAPGPAADGGAAAAAPALAQAGGTAVTAVGLARMNPPALAAVGGPPGSSGSLATTGGSAGGGVALGRPLGQLGRRCPPGQAQAAAKKKGGGGGPPGC